MHWMRAGLSSPRQDWAFAGVVMAWGAQAIVTQSILLREAMVLMFGSEFAWGIVLAAWLLGVAVGGALGGFWVARFRPIDRSFVAVVIASSVVSAIELWLFRNARSWLEIAPGELLPLPRAALAALLLVTPASVLTGAAFPLACRRLRPGVAYADAPRAALGRVYAFESTGSLVGGAAFSFWAVDHLAPIEAILLLAGMSAASCAALLYIAERFSRFVCVLVGLSLGVWTLGVLFGSMLNRALVERRFADLAPGYELVAETDSRYQNLILARLAEQYTLYNDGRISISFPDPFDLAPLAHFWMCQHPAPRGVLLLGGGAEGLLAEILRHPVRRVDYVELDARQLELVRPYLAAADRTALADERVHVHHADVRRYVKTAHAKFDLVIARLPEATSALRARLYTKEFFRELKGIMAARSVLCLTASAAPGSLPPSAAEYLASLAATLRTSFDEVTVTWGDPANLLVATAPGLVTVDPRELRARYQGRGVRSERFDPFWFDGATDWLDSSKLRQRARELAAAEPVEVSTDVRPIIYIQRLVLWDRMTGGAAGRTIERLRRVDERLPIALLAAAAIGVALLGRIGGDPRAPWARSALTLSIGTTGFVTMALSVVALFVFQNLYGYVYQRIGWIVAVFMGGLVIGSGLVAWRVRRGGSHLQSPWRRLMRVDALLAVVALSVPFGMRFLSRLQEGRFGFTIVETTVMAMLALTGVLGGAAFAWAGELRLDRADASKAAARIVIADHAGACLGALLTGIYLVPMLGMTKCACLLAAMKLASAAMLRLSGRSVDDRGR